MCKGRGPRFACQTLGSVVGSKQSGIFVHTRGVLTCENDNIFQNAKAGVQVKNRGGPGAWCRVTASSVGGRLPTAGISVRQVTATPAPGVGMPMYAGAGSGVFLLLARTTKNEESPGAIRGARVDGSRTCAAATAGRRQGSPQARCRRGEPGPPELLRRGGVGDSVAGLSRPEPGSLSHI